MPAPKNSLLNSFVLWIFGFVAAVAGAVLLFKPVDRQFMPVKVSLADRIAANSQNKAQRRLKAPKSNIPDFKIEDDRSQPIDTKLASTQPKAGKVKGSPMSAAARVQLDSAINEVDSGNWRKAEEILKELLKKEPKNEMALVEMANIYLLDRRDMTGALPYIKGALETNNNNEDMLNELINVYSETGNVDEGLDYLVNLSQNSQGSNSAVLDQGIATTLVSVKRPEEAVEYFKSAIAKGAKDEDGQLLGQMGDAYVDAGREDQAVDAYRNAIAQAEKNRTREYDQYGISELKVRLGQTYMRMGNREAALEVSRELQKEDPYSERAIAFREQLKKQNM